MARHLFGLSPADLAMERVGDEVRLRPGAVGTVWDALSGGTQLTDLLDVDGNTVTQVTANSEAVVGFYGPDDTTTCYVDFGGGTRFLMAASDLGAAVDARLPLAGGTMTGQAAFVVSPGTGVLAGRRVGDTADRVTLNEDGVVEWGDGATAGDVSVSRSATGELTVDGDLVVDGGQVVPSTACNVMQYGAVGDGTTDDTTAVQAAINAAAVGGGEVYLPNKTFKVAGLVPKTRVKIRGDAWGKATLTASGADLFALGSTYAELFEISHVRLDVTNGHVFTDGRLSDCTFDHLQMFVNTSSKSVWSASDISLAVSVRFSDCVFHVKGATRSVPAFDLTSTGVDKITHLVFRDCTCWNDDSDNTQYFFKVVCTNGSSGVNRDLLWQNIIFEQCCGGAIRVESATGCTLIHCRSWDTPANSVKADIFRFVKNSSNTVGCRGTTVIGCGRDGDGPDTGIQDVSFDGNSQQTTVINPHAQGTSVGVRINMGSSDGFTLLGVPSNATIGGDAGASYTEIQRGTVTAQPPNTAHAFHAVNSDFGGTVASLRSDGSGTGSRLITAAVTGESTGRFAVDHDGTHAWGSGSAARDTNLYRSAADTLKTDDSLIVTGALTAASLALAGSSIYPPLFARNTSDQALATSSTTLQDVTGLSVTVVSGGIYVVEMEVFYDGSGVPDMKVGWVAPASSTFTWATFSLHSSAGNQNADSMKTAVQDINSAPSYGCVALGTKVAGQAKGLLVAGGNGTFKMQAAQNTSDAGVVTIYTNSWLLLRRVA
jgi:Pectate lyase superfamily protein